MTQRPDIFVEWELQASRQFLREASRHFDARIGEVEDSGSVSEGLLSAREAMQAARRLVLESVVYQLNAVVDAFLLSCAPNTPIAGEVATGKELTRQFGRTRTILIKEIESLHSVKVSDLAGWNDVEWLRETANALKHRGGILGVAEHSSGIPWITMVQLDVDRLYDSMNGIRSWTTLLTEMVHPKKL